MGSYLGKLAKPKFGHKYCELDSMSELSGFVYIKSHSTLHVKSKAQRVNSYVYYTTRYNKCGRIGSKWLGFFIYLICCAVIEKNIDKKLANRISYQIWYKGCLKGKFGRGVQICEGGSISANGFRLAGSKSAVTPGRRIESFEALLALPGILEYKLILFRSGYFDHDMEKI